MTPKTIVIHNTANKMPADNEARYVHSRQSEVTYHYAVDDKEAIQLLPHDKSGWHAGDGGKTIGGRNGIAIEICYSTGDSNKFAKAEDNAAHLTAKLLHQFGLKVKDVSKHQDWAVDNKYCPHKTMDKGWARFIKMVEGYYKDLAKPKYETQTPILGKPTTSIEQMRQYAKNNGAPEWWYKEVPDSEIKEGEREDIPRTAYERSVAYGVDPAVTWAQSNKETAFGKYTGVLTPEYKNPCGMKTSQGGDNYDPKAHFKFWSWLNGFSGQAQHLALYAGSKGYPWKTNFDPRNFDSIKGTAPTVEELGGKWAPSESYGTDIVKRMEALRNTKITDFGQDENKASGQVKESQTKTETEHTVDYAIAYVNDGDTINALNYINSLPAGTVGLYKVKSGDDISDLPGKEIVFIGGADIKGADKVVKGDNRRETLNAVNKDIQNRK